MSVPISFRIAVTAIIAASLAAGVLFAASWTPASAQDGASPLSVTIDLGPGRDGDQQGTATLTAMGSQTSVSISITPGEAGVGQPVHIHEGMCPGVGAVAFPLTNIVDGTSTTVVDATLAELLSGTYSINVHKSQSEIALYTSCGNIPQGVVATLGAGRDESQPGAAALVARGSQTEVIISIAPGPAGVGQPVHIHEGTCPGVGAVAFPLANVVDGASSTVLDAPLSSVVTGTRSINVHKSQDEIQVYVSCGNISTAQEPTPTPTTPAQPTSTPAAPTTGNAGLQDSSGQESAWPLVFGAVAILAGATGLFALHRRA
ncbi:MAG: hypothetical protein Kow0010_13070 [Dehalococcoidia bacterium]